MVRSVYRARGVCGHAAVVLECCGRGLHYSRRASAALGLRAPSSLVILLYMTTPGTLALVLIVLAVIASNAFATLLSFIPLALFVYALAYIVQHA